MLHSDSKRRLLDMLQGWEYNAVGLATDRPDHADKYYAEAQSVFAVMTMALDLPDGNDLAVTGFVADHVLPLLLEGK